MALKLNGTNSVAAPAYAGADADTGLQCGTDEVNLVTGGTARLKIDSSGNVGIGATTLNNKLAVNGNQVLLANGQLKFADAGGGDCMLALLKTVGPAAMVNLSF